MSNKVVSKTCGELVEPVESNKPKFLPSEISKVIRHCPVCSRDSLDYIFVKSDNVKWYRCSCGCVYQGEIPKHGVYDKKYIEGYEDYKFSNTQAVHAARVYSNVLEEITDGRKILDVGFLRTLNMEYFKNRGWLPWGIDVHSEVKESDRIFKGNFEDYDFSGQEFNVIWMSHVIEHFNDPLQAIRKCYNLLREDGVLYIATPDAEAIRNLSIVNFPHFTSKEHYVLFDKRALTRELERHGYEIIMARRNPDMRYTSWHDIHIICQKRFF